MTDSRERAFPNQPHGQNGYQTGLTKRELFAAMAMQGMAADGVIRNPERWHGMTPAQAWAVEAVALADALIAELSK